VLWCVAGYGSILVSVEELVVVGLWLVGVYGGGWLYKTICILFFIFYFLYFDILKKESINTDLMGKINNNFEIDALIVKRSENKLIFF
jgi:hypothetical protein